MNGTNDCIGYINKLEYIGTNDSLGQIIISASAGGYGNTNYYFDDSRPSDAGFGTGNSYCYSAAADVLSVNPSASIIYSNTPNGGAIAGHITNGVNVAGYMSWGVHGYEYQTNADYALNGTITLNGHSGWWIIETIESFNGQREANGQGNFIKWFSSGAFGGTNYSSTSIAAVCHTDEPFLGNQNSPAFFSLWEAGKNFGICAWNSRNTRNFQAVGDPLVTK